MLLRVSDAGAGAGGISDGDTLTLDDGSGPVTIEFDNDGTSVPSTTVVNITDHFLIHVPTAGADVGGIVDGEIFEIDNGSGPVFFEFDNDGATMVGAEIINISDHVLITAPSAGGGPGGVADMQTFTIDDGSGDPAVTFEFDFDSPNMVSDPAYIPVDVTDSSLRTQVAAAMAGAITGAINSAILANINVVNLGGGTIQITSSLPNQVVDVSGSSPSLTLTTQPLSQAEVVSAIDATITANVGLGLAGTSQGSGDLVLTGTLPAHTLDTTNAPSLIPGRVPLSQSEVVTRLLPAIAATGVGLTGQNIGDGGIVLVGSTTMHSVDTSGSAGLTDVERPALQAEIAAELANVIGGVASLGLTPTNMGSGSVHLGGLNHTLVTIRTPAMTVSDAPGIVTTATPSFRIPYVPNDPSSRMALRIIDAINVVTDPVVVATFDPPSFVRLSSGVSFNPDTSPLTPDGVVAIPFAVDSTAGEVGSAMAAAISGAGLGGASTADFLVEPNDSFATAFDSGIDGTGGFAGSGVMGDGTSFFDVDFVEVQLNAGDNITIDIDAAEIGSTFDPIAYLQNSFGSSLSISFDDPAPGEPLNTIDSYIDFTVPSTGTYFVGIEGSFSPSNGPYEIFISVNGSTAASGGVGLSSGRVNVPDVVSIVSSDLPPFFVEGAPGVGVGNTPVMLDSGMSESQVARSVAESLSQAIAGHGATIRAVDASQLSDRDEFTITANGITTTFEFDTGFSLQVPRTLEIQVPAGAAGFFGGSIVNDGETFTIGGGGTVRTFEFDNDSFVGTGNVPILLAGSPTPDTQESIAKKIVVAVAGAGLGLNPSNLGGGRVLLGSNASHFLSVPFFSSLSQAGQAAGLEDGEGFLINDGVGGPNVVFEFDSDASTVVGAIRIDTTDIAIAVPLAGGDTINGGIADGELFTVNDGSIGAVSFVFEFDDDGVFVDANSDGVPDNTLILLQDPLLLTPFTQDEMVDRIVAAISGVPSLQRFPSNAGTGAVRLNGLNHMVDVSSSAPSLTIGSLPATQAQITTRLTQAIAVAGLGLTPTDLRDGRIHIGGTTHVLDTSDAAQLGRSGHPGVSFDNIAVPIVPWQVFSANQVAQAIDAAIDTARQMTGLNVDGSQQGRRLDLVELGKSLVSVDTSNIAALGSDTPAAGVKLNKELVHVINNSVVSQTLGPLGLHEFGFEDTLPGDFFGAFDDSGPRTNITLGAVRGQDNLHEGAYIDDIIIGFTGRGEMVLQATDGAEIDENFELLDDELREPHNETLIGEYQLEIRQGAEYGVWPIGTLASPGSLTVLKSFNVNSRVSQSTTLVVPGGADIADGERFTLTDGTNIRVFEFEDLTLEVGNAHVGVTPGNVSVAYRPSQTAEQMAELLRDRINNEHLQGSFGVSAAKSDGVAEGITGTGHYVNLDGGAVFGESSHVNAQINSGDTFSSDEVFRFENTSATGAKIDSITLTLPGGFGFTTATHGGTQGTNIHRSSNNVGPDFSTVTQSELTVDFSRFGPGQKFIFGLEITSPVFNRFGTAYGRELAGTEAEITFSDGTVLIESFTRLPTDGGVAAVLGAGLKAIVFDGSGDENVKRDQGQIVIQSNIITDSNVYALLVDSGQRTRGDLSVLGATNPHQGPPINYDATNNERLAPGAVISNNVIARGRSGGILFSGDTNNGQPGAVPFGRIVNNTIYGGGATDDTGIQVEESVSPTLLNNVIVDFNVGISVDSSSATTVIGANLFQDNLNNGIINGTVFGPTAGPGSFPIVLSPGDALFVDAASSNFYPEAGSLVIDSSLDSLQDRANYANSVRGPLGIAPSPILAPDRDVFGQLRVDDPTVSTPTAQGSNVFKDRGALDRADRLGPIAQLIGPRDNDADGNDVDPNETYVSLASGVLNNFEILLVDTDGTGPDAGSISSEAFTLFENGRTLVEGIDYVFGFNATSNTIRFTPFSGIWRPASIYELALNNRDRIVIDVPDVVDVNDGLQFTIEGTTGAVATFEFESGYSIQVPETFSLQIPERAAGLGGIADGESFTVGDGTQFRIFEFDFNGNSSPLSTAIALDSADTLDQIADKIVLTLVAADLGLSPRNLGDGVVELGSLANHNLDTSPSSLTQSGQATGIADGEFFTVEDSDQLVNGSPRLVTFEFDDDGSVGPGSVTIDLQVPTNDQTPLHILIAERVEAAILTEAIGLPATDHLGDGLVHLAGTPAQLVDVTASILALSGLPGVASSLTMQIPLEGTGVGGILDGEVIVISDGTNTVSFEIDLDGNTAAGNTPVSLGAGSTQDEVTNALVNVISNDGTLNLTPTNEGAGVLRLNETVLHSVDVSMTRITLAGVAGGAIPILFLPSSTAFTQTQLQGAIINAINRSGLTSVVATPRGTETIFVDSAVDVQNISNFPLAAITDVAGNPLQPNRPPNDSRFTIQTPGVVLDYGDAPDSDLAPQYPTLLANNGARHVILDELNGLYLGSAMDVLAIDPEADGQPNANADGDDTNGDADEGGVAIDGIFTPTFETLLTITSSGVGFVDGWVDYNQDGDWNDPGERILDSVAVVAGMNALVANTTPSGALLGETFARFRLSRVGPTFPTGLVVDGEVEDYAVRVISNVPPTVVGSGIPDVLNAIEDPSEPAELAILTFDVSSYFDDLDLPPSSNNDSLTFSVAGNDNVTLVSPTIGAGVGILTLTLLQDQNGTAAITIRATDRGSRFVEDTFMLTVAAVNDEPEIVAAPSSADATEDTPKSISGISVADVDAVEGTGDIRVTLQANSGGQLTVRTDVATGLIVTGNDSSEVVLEGTPAEINATLGASAGLVYLGDLDFSGTESVVIEVNDLGNWSGPAKEATPHTITVTVAAENDAPTISIPAGLITTPEDVDKPITGLQISDPDVGAGDMQVALNVNNGTLSLANGLAGLVHSGDGTSAISIQGKLNDINLALQGMVYSGDDDFNGTSTISINVSDLGNTPGPAMTATAELPITVSAVNDKPEFLIDATQVLQEIIEDAGLQRISEFVLQDSISAGPTDEIGQTLGFELSFESLTGTLAFTTREISVVTGDLTYQTDVDTNGVVVIRVVLVDNLVDGQPQPDSERSDPQFFTIVVEAINDAPSFDPGPNQIIDEDAGDIVVPAWAKNLMIGPSTARDEEFSQVLDFPLLEVVNGLSIGELAFDQWPTIDSTTGNLTYRTAPDTNGQRVFDVRLLDSGPDGILPNNPLNVNVSQTHRLTITVIGINDPPEFTIAGTSQTIDEDSDEVTVDNFITGIVRGPISAVDEEGQVVQFDTSFLTTGSLVFETLPKIMIDETDGTGDLVFKPLPDTNGQSVVTLTLNDSGSNIPPNVNSSVPQTFTITVNAINDAPTFTVGPDVMVVEDSGLQTLTGWVSDASAGPNEAQTLTFDLRVNGVPTDNLSFATPPRVNQNGDLSFEPTVNTSGTATVVISLTDDGSGSPPNENTSTEQTFSISVTATNDPPVVINPISDVTVDEDAANTEIEVFPSVFQDVDINLFENDQLTLTAASSDPSLVQVNLPASPIIDVSTNTLMLSLDYQPDRNGQAVVQVTATDGDNESATSVFTVTVNAVNDAPTVGGVTAISVPEDTISSLDGVVIGDIDAAESAGKIEVTFRVSQGILSLRSNVAGGVMGSEITVNDGATVVVKATPVAIATTLAASNGLTYLGNTDYNGSDDLVITVADEGASGSGGSLVTTTTIDLTVTAVNDSPIATNDSRTTAEDTVLSFSAASLRVNDVPAPFTATDEASQMLVVSIPANHTSANGGIVTLINGTINYTPPLDFNTPFNGVDTFTYTVTDDGQPAQSTTGLVTVTVTSVNDAPIALGDGQSTSEDVPLVFDASVLAANDLPGPTDELGQFLTVTAVDPTTANGGIVSLISGSIRYIPSADFVGQDEVVYTVRDNGFSGPDADPRESKGTLTVVVTEVNDAPTANDDDQTALEDTELIIDVPTIVANDSRGAANEANQTLTVTGVSALNPTGSTVTLLGNLIAFQAPADFNGIATFAYIVEDNGTTNGSTATKMDVGTVTITVNEVNDAPIAIPDNVNATEDTALQFNGTVLTINDQRGPSNESSQGLTIDSVSATSAQGGFVSLNSQVITYIPPTDFTGTDTFTYRAIDDGTTNGVLDGRTATTVVTVTIAEVNDPPIPTDDNNQTALEDTELIIDVPTIVANDSRGAANEANQTLTVTGVSALNPTGSTVTLLGNLIAFQAPADFNGIATFAYIVEDNGTTNGALDPKQGVGVVSVTVTPVNDPPIAIDDSRLVNEDEVLTIVADDPTTGLIANDFGGPLDEQNEPLTVVGVTPNSNAGGAVTLVGGIVTYTPPANFNGTDQFTYDVEDAAGERATGTVNLTINAVNDAPVAVPDAYATHEDEKLTIAGKGVLDNDFDIDIPANTLTVIQAQTLSKLGAALTVNSDGTVEYDPTGAPMLQALQPGQSARDEFVYSISDGTGAGNSVSNDATVTITVGGRNDAPVGQDDGPYSILEDQTLVVDVVTGVLTNDSDPENDTLSALIVSQPGNGAVTLQANGSFTYTPRTNFNGLDTFQYRASDGILSSNIVTVSIDVLSDPENPIAVGDSYTTDGNTTLTVSAQAGVLANDTDDDGPLSARVVNGPSNGTLNLNSDGSFVYTPTVGFVGGDSFTYEAVDGENLVSNAAIVTIQVNSTALWQNPRNNKDVNNDGIVSPQDALIVINRLNSGPDGSILDPETTPPPPPYYDVNGDGIVSPADVLIVINCINSEGSGGEGEGAFGDPVHQGEGEASLVNVDAFDFLPLHSDDHLGSHLDVGPRRNATAVGEEDYFGRLGLSNARPSIPASRLASSQTSDAAATSRVDEILDEFADDVAGVFGDDSFLDGLL